jgi:hypothetical protein
MQYLILIKQFVSENQMLLTAALLIASYFLKRLVDHYAARPQADMWDSIKPGSDALYALVHKGVEYAANAKGLDSAKKLLAYAEKLAEFERLWSTDKARAVQELAAWYLSMQAKQVTANPSTEPAITADSPARE